MTDASPPQQPHGAMSADCGCSCHYGKWPASATCCERCVAASVPLPVDGLDKLWDALWTALPASHDKVEVTIIAYRGSTPFVSIGSGSGLAIGHCGQWVSWNGQVGAASVEEALREYARLTAPKEGAVCSGCGGRRWAEDENWSPDLPETWKGERSHGNGLVPCGFCNEGGWKTPDWAAPKEGAE